MIKYNMIGDRIVLEQVVKPPTISMDTWFWRILSNKKGLRDRFIEVSKDSNITIMYSFASMLELLRITDDRQILAFIEVMENLDYGFFHSTPQRVIENENSQRSDPIADSDFIKQFHYMLNPLKPFNIADFFRKLYEQNNSDYYKKLFSEFGDGLLPLIEKARSDSKVINNAKSRLKGKNLTAIRRPYTRDIYRYALDFVQVNQNMNMPNKEWFDLFNTIVPVAYFDYVVLDKRWSSFVNNYIPLKHPDIAQIYNKSTIEKLLKDIESRNSA